MSSTRRHGQVPFFVATPPDGDEVPSLSQMPSQMPQQLWRDGFPSWQDSLQMPIAGPSGQMATPVALSSWQRDEGPQTSTQGHQFEEDQLYYVQNDSFPAGSPNSSQGLLRHVSVIPEHYRSLFSQFPYFNIVQSTVFDDVFYTDRPLIVSAPTGSGKTVVMELALVRLLMTRFAGDQESQSPPRVVYMAPMKALVTERYEDWKARFGALGIACAQVTGDTEQDDITVIGKSQVILTTPEKWDSLTRRWRDHASLMEAVFLLMIDEVHVLGDEARGPTLEAVVSRMKTIRTTRPSSSPHQPPLRFVAVSATIPNVDDLAMWLSDDQGPAVTHKLDESLRPVKLRRVVLGYDFQSSWTEFRFELSLTYRVAGVVAAYSENKPTLVFVSTRKMAQMTATTLIKEARLVRNAEHKQVLMSVANLLRDNKLRDCVLSGAAYHHAGLESADRRQIEDLFTSGHLPVLIATSTLAMGVNLPAHLVIVLSTVQYNGHSGGYDEYSSAQILQMIGRAGRPQFDSHATAVIMTKKGLKAKYENLVNGKGVLESHLHQHLTEHLNAEIVLGTVTDLGVAVEWLRSTFFYVRVQRNPRYYGLQTGLQPHQLEAKLQEICTREVNALARAGMILQNEVEMQPLTPGRLMARYCVSFATMNTFTQFRGDESLKELVEVVSNCQEFWDVKIRTSEKRLLNEMNKSQGTSIRFPIKGKVKTRQQKIYCLIQAAFGSQTIADPSLGQDTNKIFRTGQRITKCLAEYGATRDEYDLHLNTSLLAKCFTCRLWENSRHVTRQLERIGATFSAALVQAKVTSFTALEAMSPRDVELILNRQPPFGNKIRDQAIRLPRYELTLQQTNQVSSTWSEVRVSVVLANKEALGTSGATTPRHHSCRLVLGDQDNQVVFHQRITDAALLVKGSISRSVTVTRARGGDELAVNLISESWAGLDVQSCYTPRYLGPPPAPPPVATPSLNEAQNPQGDAQNVKTGWRSCMHACGDKKTCAHSCCKVGVSDRGGRCSNSSNSSNNGNSSGNSRNSSSKQGQDLPGLVQEMKKRAGQLPFTPSKKIKMANTGGCSRGGDTALSRFRYSPNLPRLLPNPVRPSTSPALPQENRKQPTFSSHGHSVSKSRNQTQPFPLDQCSSGSGVQEGDLGGFSSIEEQEAYKDLLDFFGNEDKENFPNDLGDIFELPMTDEEQNDYDDAFTEPLGIEDDLLDQVPYVQSGNLNAYQPQNQQQGGSSKPPGNSHNQKVSWNRKPNAASNAQGSHRSGQFQSPPVGQASRIHRPPSTQGNQAQRPPSIRFQSPYTTHDNRYQSISNKAGSQMPIYTQNNQLQGQQDGRVHNSQRFPSAHNNQFSNQQNAHPPVGSGGTDVNQMNKPSSVQTSHFNRTLGSQANQFNMPLNSQSVHLNKVPSTQGNRIPLGNAPLRPSAVQGIQIQRPPFMAASQLQRASGIQSNRFQRPPGAFGATGVQVPLSQFQGMQNSQSDGQPGEQSFVGNVDSSRFERQTPINECRSFGNRMMRSPQLSHFLPSFAGNMNSEQAFVQQEPVPVGGVFGEFEDATEDSFQYATGYNSQRGEFSSPLGGIANEVSAMPFQPQENFAWGPGFPSLTVTRNQTRAQKNPVNQEGKHIGLPAVAPLASTSRDQQSGVSEAIRSSNREAPQQKPLAGVKPFVTPSLALKGNKDHFSHLTKEWATQRNKDRVNKAEIKPMRHAAVRPPLPEKVRDDWRDLEVFQWCRQQERQTLDSLYKECDVQADRCDALQQPLGFQYPRTPNYHNRFQSTAPGGPSAGSSHTDDLGSNGGPSNVGVSVTNTRKDAGTGAGTLGVTLTSLGGIQQNININLSNFVESGMSSEANKPVSQKHQMCGDPHVRGILKNTSQSVWNGPSDIFQGIL